MASRFKPRLFRTTEDAPEQTELEQTRSAETSPATELETTEDRAYVLNSSPEVQREQLPRSFERAINRSYLFPSWESGVRRPLTDWDDAALSEFPWLIELRNKDYDDLEVRKNYGANTFQYTKALAETPVIRQMLFETLEEYQSKATQSYLLGVWFDASVRPESEFWGGAGPSPDAYIRLSQQVTSLRSTSLSQLPTFHLARGGLAYLAGNEAEAALHYREAVAAVKAGISRLDQLSLGIFTAGCLEDFMLAQGGHGYPGWLNEVSYIEEPTEGDVLMLVGCDEVYFAAFAEDLVRSASDVEMSADLHFHVYNPTAFTEALFRQIQEMFPGIKLSLSAETFHIRDIRAAYTCIRYWRLPQFLDRWNRPILLVDADCQFKGDIAGTIDRGAHLGFRRFPQYPGIHPWRDLSANTFYARPTNEGKSFTRSLAKYLTYVFDPNGTANWWVDQNALSVAFKHYTRYSNRRWTLLNGPSAQYMDLLHRKTGIIDAARARIAEYNGTTRE